MSLCLSEQTMVNKEVLEMEYFLISLNYIFGKVVKPERTFNTGKYIIMLISAPPVLRVDKSSLRH